MLFNSPEFIFLFLPITLIMYFILAHFNRLSSLIWLSAASLFFYGYWNPRYLPLIGGSILFNYLSGRCILSLQQKEFPKLSKYTLIFGISGDLLLLGYYKYADFFITIENQLAHAQHSLLGVILPLGISFFTFTQIAYLVDCFRNDVKEQSFIKYILFVTYFPHLIAGPILHHKEMIPQFGQKSHLGSNPNLSAGLAMFAIGLAKKLFFADTIASLSNMMFDAAHATGALTTSDAWLGALAYTLQIYFDFSGYSDMAIGLSILFGVKLPINFYSPYKANSIIEFWRRWHITLSRFLRDYLYVPLGGNRKGHARRYLNLFITMLLGGLWHGAGWTFLIWGALHGTYLIINHGWRYLCQELNLTLKGHLYETAATLLTFLSVMIAWVFFRAPDTKTAFVFLHAMFSFAPISATPQTVLTSDKIMLGLLLFIAWFLPNSLQIISRYEVALSTPIQTSSQGTASWYQ